MGEEHAPKKTLRYPYYLRKAWEQLVGPVWKVLCLGGDSITCL